MNLVVACMSCVGGDVLHKDGQKARGWDLAGAALKKQQLYSFWWSCFYLALGC